MRLPTRDSEGCDYAIVGAGAAGLSLALQLTEAFPARSVTLFDPGLGDLDNLTFAFWSPGEPPLTEAVSRSWSRVRVVADRTAEGALDAYRYHVIEGHRFGEIALARLATRPVSRVPVAVTAIEPVEGGSFVVAGAARVFARWVFDSRLDLEAVPADPARNVALTQRFLGWEVETEADAFDDEAVTLFDFGVPQGRDVRFVYTLPFSPRRALIEHVSHHAHDAREDLAAYVAAMGLPPYRIVRREAGQSPLTDAVFPRRAGPRWLRVGVAGGRLKPSSGYAFVRIWEDSRAIVRSLAEHGHPFALPADPAGFALLDGLMLRVMRRSPARMGAIFLRLFERNPADRVLRFLDEAATLDEVLALGSSLPPGPFARALGEDLRGRVKAALCTLREPVG